MEKVTFYIPAKEIRKGAKRRQEEDALYLIYLDVVVSKGMGRANKPFP